MNSDNDFQVQMKQKVQKIEGILQEYLPRQKGLQSVVMEAMGYSLMAGGKRLRPMLMQETFLLYNGTAKSLRPLTILWCTMIFRQWIMTSIGGGAGRPTLFTEKIWES